MLIKCQKHHFPPFPICTTMLYVSALVTNAIISGKKFGTTVRGSQLLQKHSEPQNATVIITVQDCVLYVYCKTHNATVHKPLQPCVMHDPTIQQYIILYNNVYYITPHRNSAYTCVILCNAQPHHATLHITLPTTVCTAQPHKTV